MIEVTKQRVGTPDGWNHVDNLSTPLDPLDENHMSGSVVFGVWERIKKNVTLLDEINKSDEEITPEETARVRLYMHESLGNKGEDYSVELEIDGGVLHAHGAETLEAAYETVSTVMYMYNHYPKMDIEQ